MGEAARRKKIDANYGKVPSLKTSDSISKYGEIIIEDLFDEFKELLRNVMLGKSDPENYQEELLKIQQGLDKRLSNYRDVDRPMLVKYLLVLISELSSEIIEDEEGNPREVSPMLMFYLLKAGQKYLTLQENQTLLTGFKELVASGQQLGIKSCGEFLNQKITEEIKLLGIN